MTRTTLRLGSRGADVEALQEILREKFHSTIVVDGVFGPRTRSEVFRVQNDLRLAVDGIVGPKTWSAIEDGEVNLPDLPIDEYMKRVVTIAEAFIGTREDPPESNRGPMVDRIIQSVGLTPPAQWCMAFCYFVHNDAAKAVGAETNCPKTARCSYGWRKAVEAGLWYWSPTLVFSPEPEILGGEVFMRVRGGRPRSSSEADELLEAAEMVRRGKNLNGHVGIVTHLEGRRLGTIEGNTNGFGSAQGDGVYRRWIDLDDPRLVGVYRPRAVP